MPLPTLEEIEAAYRKHPDIGRYRGSWSNKTDDFCTLDGDDAKRLCLCPLMVVAYDKDPSVLDRMFDSPEDWDCYDVAEILDADGRDVMQFITAIDDGNKGIKYFEVTPAVFEAALAVREAILKEDSLIGQPLA